MKALLRLCYGSIKAVIRRYEGSIKALLRFYYGSITVLLRVEVGTKAQKVVCHFDEFHNFTYVINGTKTFVLAPFDKVLLGPEKEPKTNRKVDTSSSDFSRAVISPGQLLYLPKNWWHEVSLAYSDTYVSFSSSTIGMHYSDSRTDSPQSFLFFPDTAAGEDKPRRCFEFGDVVQGPQGRRLATPIC